MSVGARLQYPASTCPPPAFPPHQQHLLNAQPPPLIFSQHDNTSFPIFMTCLSLLIMLCLSSEQHLLHLHFPLPLENPLSLSFCSPTSPTHPSLLDNNSFACRKWESRRTLELARNLNLRNLCRRPSSPSTPLIPGSPRRR